MLQPMMTQPCTIVSVAGTGTIDGGNNPAPVESRVDARCFVDWSRSRLRASDQSVAEAIGGAVVPICFPAGTVIGQAARVIVGSTEWQVEGIPVEQWDPLAGSMAFVEALCTQTKVKTP